MEQEDLYNSHNLAENIKKAAKTKGIVLGNMLKELGLGSNTMSALYHGKSIAFDSLARIADYLDCSVDSLLDRAHLSKEEMYLLELIKMLSDEEVAQVSEYVNFILSKKKE